MIYVANIVFQYIFVITNSFTGVIVFLLHNARHPRVIAFWSSCFGVRKHLRLPTTSSSKTFTTSASINSMGRGLPASTKRKPKDTLAVPTLLPGNKQGNLLQTKMYSSTESDTSYASNVTNTSDV